MTATNEQRREEEPASLRTVALCVVMGLLALVGIAGTVTTGVILVINRQPLNLTTVILLAMNLVVGAIGVWGLAKLKPWQRSGEPLSPATRRTNRLFTWSGVLSVPAAVLLIYGSRGHPSGVFSNSPVAPGIAIAAIAFWLVAMALAWWWYASTDEHDRQAYDFGNLVGGGVFITVTPAWWVAARAGLLPQPDAMVLWFVTIIVLQFGWFWRRYR
jgi:hypothetical protein